MNIVVFSDVVTRCNTKEDRHNTDRLYYVGGEHIISNEMKVLDRGIIKGSTIGPMFYCGFKKGDILFVTRNPHLRKCGMVDFDGICSEKTFVLETKDKNVLLQEYLALVMQSEEFWSYCDENKSGGVNFFVNWSTLAEYEFVLPPLEEQKRVAEKLWAAYEVKQSYVSMIAATDEMVKSQFIELFGDAPKIKLGEVATYVNGSSYSTDDWSTDGLPIIRIQNLTQDNVACNLYNGDTSSKVLINDGDILISWSATLGVFVWNRGRALLNQHIFKVIFNKKEIDRNFFIYAVKHVLENMKERVHGSTMQHIVKKDFDNTLIAYPLDEEQKLFATIVNQADKSKFELRKAIDSIDKVIKSLINNQ